ncbi:MAG: hypothetical protein AB7T18_20095 [Alphaproteobacteria bacterium]
MRRLKDYLRFLSWQAGLGYIALWAVTLWTLDHGSAVFGHSGVCRPDAAKVLFYWVCDPQSPLTILASVCNTALTVTVWAPVYLAAATVRPDAIVLALPIVSAHLIGLPTAIFVTIRLMLGLTRLVRLAPAPALPAGPEAPAPEPTAIDPQKYVNPRAQFGLRGTHQS